MLWNDFDESYLESWYKIMSNMYDGKTTSFALPYTPITKPSGNESPKIASDWQYIEKNLMPDGQVISEAYPNPFATTTSFGINLPDKQNVIIELYNDQCSKVQTIYAGELSKGVHDFKINGNELSSGLYLFKVTGNNFVQTGKVILTK
jgi:hypothetical protein